MHQPGVEPGSEVWETSIITARLLVLSRTLFHRPHSRAAVRTVRLNPVAFDTCISPQSPRRPTHGDAYGRVPASPTRRRRWIGSSAHADASTANAGRRAREGHSIDRARNGFVSLRNERARTCERRRVGRRARGRFIHSLTHAFIHSFVGNSFDRTIRAVTANERKN